jgi:hypothetical protein
VKKMRVTPLRFHDAPFNHCYTGQKDGTSARVIGHGFLAKPRAESDLAHRLALSL